MAIQTEVTLQPDYYVLSACDGGKNPALQKLLFYHLVSVPDGHCLRLCLYFQMCHHAMYMNNDHHFCISLSTCITVSDFILLRTRVYHVD